jgi:hypothetical protein
VRVGRRRATVDSFVLDVAGGGRARKRGISHAAGRKQRGRWVNAHALEALALDPVLPETTRLLADLERPADLVRRPVATVVGSCAGRRRLIRRAGSARAARDALGTARDAEADAAAGNLILDRAQARGGRRALRKEDDAREPGNDVQVGERLKGSKVSRINIDRCSLRFVS